MQYGSKNKILMKKGAEASIFLEHWQERKVLMKRRIVKKYRFPELDKKIRTRRTIKESQLIHDAKKAGVPTPTILMVDLNNSNIAMEFVEGLQIKQVLNNLTPDERQILSKKIGELIGLLHSNSIIHGDLTTSNMILTPSDDIVFVDFGLGEKTTELEAKGIDLHLMKRALQSTHFIHAEDCFQAVLEGYSRQVGGKITKEVSEKIDEIEMRGRYISERKHD